ncbi:Mannan endo-1,6-alpha-mannosidase DCW1, partial [Tolypocladium capitatum]
TAIANGCFFNIGARLARYTGNETYAKRAEDSWDWLWGTNFIDHDIYFVYDGAHVDTNCTDINRATFSYNAAVMLQGAAYMYNFPQLHRLQDLAKSYEQTDGDRKWKYRVNKLTDSLLSNFFPEDIAYEVPCESRKGACSPDMLSFKGYVHRWLAVVTQIAPFTRNRILPVLRKSTEAAVKQCTGGDTGRVCGFYWSDGVYVDISVDRTSGAGEAMNVLAAVSSLLIEEAKVPVTDSSGGISKGNPNAGGGRDNGLKKPKPITTADRAGAGILTLLLLGGAASTFIWMSVFE